MTEVRDEISENIQGRLNEAADSLAEAESSLEGLGSDRRSARPNVYRLEAAVEYAHKALAWADPTVTREQLSHNMLAYASQARDAANAALNEDGGDLVNAADNLLSVATQLEPQTLATEEEAKSAAASFRQSFGPRMRGLENEFEAVKGNLNATREATEQSVQTAVNRLAEVQQEIDGLNARVGEVVGEQESRFEEAENGRGERFSQAISKAEDDFDNARLSFDQRVVEAMNHIAELEEEISQTAAALGGNATAIDNNNESAEQAGKAFWWTVVTVALLILAAAIPLAIGIEDSSQSPESVAGKITVGLILAGIAAYTAGVAGHHRQRAAAARRLALELNAFGPFIAPLEKVDRDDLRSTIIWRFFGPPDAQTQEHDAEPTPGPGIAQILKLRRKARDPAPQSDQV